MLPFGVTIPVTVPQRSEIPEGIMNNPVYTVCKGKVNCKSSYNWSDNNLYTRLKLVARQLTIVSSVFCVTWNTDAHYECYTNRDGLYKDYYFLSLALEFIELLKETSCLLKDKQIFELSE
jgi:hypothetical protein